MRNFQLRLNRIIKEETANFIENRLESNLLLTITSVVCNDDGSRADIFYVVIPESNEDIKRCQKIFELGRTDMQNIISRKHGLRKTPIFNFCYDEEYSNVKTIDKVLDIIDNERSKI